MFSRIRKTTIAATATLVATVLLLTGGVTAAVAAPDITLTGLVYVDSVAATAGAATLTVERWDGSAWQSYPGSALTGSHGRYSIAGVDAGDYRIRATASDPVRYPDGLSSLRTVSGSGSSWNMGVIYLNRAYPVSGHVDLDEPGTNAGAGEVDIVFRHPGCCETTTVTTDANGDFALRLTRGTYSVGYRADDPAYMHRDRTLSIVTGVDPAPLPSVTLLRWPTISGHVENASGQPLSGIRVEAEAYNETGGYLTTISTTTGPSGDYTVGPLLSDGSYTYEVYFVDPAGVYATVGWGDVSPYYYPDVVIAGPGDQVTDVDAVLRRSGAIEGTVSGVGLVPLDFAYMSAEVMVFDEGAGAWVRTYDAVGIDEHGGYRIVDLYPDRYRIFVYFYWAGGFTTVRSGALDVGESTTRVFDAVISPPDQRTTSAFVRAVYWDFLGRGPSSGESNALVQRLTSGQVSRYGAATELSRSDEWIRSVITAFYLDTLNREPDAAGLQGWVTAARNGMPIAQIAAAFYSSPEYFDTVGNSEYTTWVTDLYLKLLLRSPDAAGLDSWVTALERGVSRDAVAMGFYQSPEKLGVRIAALYARLLGREPELSGVVHWLPFVASHGDLVLAAAIAGSQEYFNRAQLLPSGAY